MAYDYFATNQKDEKDDGTTSSAQNLGPQGAGAITSDGQDAPKTDTKSGSSGEFTNLQSYLDANSNTNFGSQVAGKVQGDIDTASQIQKNDAGAFQGQVDKSTVKDDQDLRNSALSDPSSFVNDPAQMAAFTKMRDAKYQGPSSFAGTDLFSDADNATKRASEEASLSNSDSGRGALLDKFYGAEAGRSDYTPGQRKLDQLLVANDPNSRAAFAQVQGNASQTGQNFQNLNGFLDNYAAQADKTTQDTRNKTRQAVGIDDAGNALDENSSTPGALQTSLKTIDDEVQARRGDLQSAHTSLDNVYGKKTVGELSAEQLSRLGLSPSDYGQIDPRAGYTRTKSSLPGAEYAGAVGDNGALYGVDPGKYLDFTNNADLTRGSVATADQQAKLDALTKLAGVANTWIPASSAGTPGALANSPLSQFRKDDFNTAEKTARDAYTKDTQDVMKHFDSVAQSGGLVSRPDIVTALNQLRAKYGLSPI